MNQILPIEFICAALKNMHNIGAIEPFTFHDVRLHPNHLLRRTEFHPQAKQFVILRALEPRVIDFAKPVAGAKN